MGSCTFTFCQIITAVHLQNFIITSQKLHIHGTSSRCPLPQLLITSIRLSVSMNFSVLDNSYQRIQAVFVLCVSGLFHLT